MVRVRNCQLNALCLHALDKYRLRHAELGPVTTNHEIMETRRRLFASTAG